MWLISGYTNWIFRLRRDVYGRSPSVQGWELGWWTDLKKLLREQGYQPRTAAQWAYLSWLTPLFFWYRLHSSQGISSLLAALLTREASKQGLRHLCFTPINLKSFKRRTARTVRQQPVGLWLSAWRVLNNSAKPKPYTTSNFNKQWCHPGFTPSVAESVLS